MRKICHKTGRSFKRKQVQFILAKMEMDRFHKPITQSMILRNWLWSNYGALI